MAGTLVANTINTDTGVFQTNNAYLGVAKAWVNFVGASATVNNSFNISSVTRNGSGDYTFNFTTAMPNANYCAVGAGNLTTNGGNYPVFIPNGLSSSPYYSTATTTSMRGCFNYSLSNGTLTQDPTIAQVVFFGS